MSLSELHWLHHMPAACGILKASPEDFVVTEDLGYGPDGEGEHLLIRIRKRGCNTRFVADALAKYLKVNAREVSFAGQKDKYSIAEQWFCVRLPGKAMPSFANFTLEGCEVLQYSRHRRKLRLGALNGNHFTLMLREVSDRTDVENRLNAIFHHGVPNYFGSQRFGLGDSNLNAARRWADGSAPPRDRNKRSFALSAARSAMFNHLACERLKNKALNQVVNGDALQLAGRGSWFVAEPDHNQTLQARVDARELMLTAPLPGSGDWGSQREALAFEQANLVHENALLVLLDTQKVAAARRAIMLYPQQMHWHWWDNATLELAFWLPAGSFATSVVRELITTAENYADIAE